QRKVKGIRYGEEETDWFQLELWNREAEFAAATCAKGKRIGVQGSLVITTWTDREGNERKSPRIRVR
ncbi:unnamed protein product, partial [Discosporangium mesarthrocarpum]